MQAVLVERAHQIIAVINGSYLEVGSYPRDTQELYATRLSTTSFRLPFGTTFYYMSPRGTNDLMGILSNKTMTIDIYGNYTKVLKSR